MTRLERALACVRTFGHVIPCHPLTKLPIFTHADIRQPDFETAWPADGASKGGPKCCTTAEQVEVIWREYPDANLAVNPGRAGLAVIDIEHEADELDILCLQLPPTLTARSARGGRHLYCKGSVPATVQKLAPKVDTRGTTGYVLVPPSVFHDPDTGIEGTYSWVDPDVTPAPLPDAIAARLAKVAAVREAPANVVTNHPLMVADAKVYMGNLVTSRDIAHARDHGGGGGNQRTFDIFAKLVRDKALSVETAVRLVEESGWNDTCIPPWSHDELVGLAEHALEYSQNDRGCDLAPALEDAKPGSEVFAPYVADRLTATARAGASPYGRHRLIDPVEAANRPPLTYWDGNDLFPAWSTVGMVFGGQGTHKSGLLLGMAVDLVFNHPDRPRVLFFVGEGEHGFAVARLPAICQLHGKSLYDLRAAGRFFYSDTVPFLLAPQDTQDALNLIADCRPNIIIAETVSCMLNGGDEIKDMPALLAGMRRMKAVCGSSVWVSHHVGKNAEKGPRGHSVQDGDLDVILYATMKDPSTQDIFVRKMKDGRAHRHVQFRVEWLSGTLPNGATYTGVPVIKPQDADQQRTAIELAAAMQAADIFDPANVERVLAKHNCLMTEGTGITRADLARLMTPQYPDEHEDHPAFKQRVGETVMKLKNGQRPRNKEGISKYGHITYPREHGMTKPEHFMWAARGPVTAASTAGAIHTRLFGIGQRGSGTVH